MPPAARDRVDHCWGLVSCRRNFSTPVRQYCMESGFSKNKDFPPGINSLSFEPTIPSKFMVGTEQGGVIICRSAVCSDWRRAGVAIVH